MDEKKRLEELRSQLAEVDHLILRQLERRARIAQEIIRARSGTARFAPVIDDAALSALEHAAAPPLAQSAVRATFVAIDAACRGQDIAPRVVYLGAEGGPGFVAARDHFGLRAELLRRETVAQALDEVASAKVEFAVVPYESLKDGLFFTTIQAIAARDLKLVGEREIEASAPLSHNGVARENGTGEGEERVRYGVISKLPAPRSGHDATALLFGVHDRPGALHEILQHFKDKSGNLRRIQSRPVPGEGWEYMFYVEVSGHVTDRNLVAALEGIKREAKMLKIIGSFPLEHHERSASSR